MISEEEISLIKKAKAKMLEIEEYL